MSYQVGDRLRFTNGSIYTLIEESTDGVSWYANCPEYTTPVVLTPYIIHKLFKKIKKDIKDDKEYNTLFI